MGYTAAPSRSLELVPPPKTTRTSSRVRVRRFLLVIISHRDDPFAPEL